MYSALVLIGISEYVDRALGVRTADKPTFETIDRAWKACPKRRELGTLIDIKLAIVSGRNCYAMHEMRNFLKS